MEKGCRNRCKTEGSQLLLRNKNSCTVLHTHSHTLMCTHNVKMHLLKDVCLQAREECASHIWSSVSVPLCPNRSPSLCVSASLLLFLSCSSLWMIWGDPSDPKWQAVLSLLSAQAAADEPCWKVAKATTDDRLLTALTSVCHIFLRITLYLSAPFTVTRTLSGSEKTQHGSADFQEGCSDLAVSQFSKRAGLN